MVFPVEVESIKSGIIVIDNDAGSCSMLAEISPLHGNDLSFFTDLDSLLPVMETLTPDIFLIGCEKGNSAGFDACMKIKAESRLQDIPIIFLSTDADPASKVRAFELGAVDYITKPFQISEVRARVSVHLKLSLLQEKLKFRQMMERKVKEVSDAQLATIFALAKLAEQRDGDTGAHLERVREFCRILAVRLGENSAYSDKITPEFIECIQHAAPLHDVGKIAIPDSVLLKRGVLTPEEFRVMKSHTIIGAENMQTVYNHYSGNMFIGMGIEIALYHHERWDGSGYPDGLIGRNIPLSARIMALADVYDALRADRCYRNGFSHAIVRSMIGEEEGTHFDPVIVKAFFEIEARFDRVYEDTVMK